MRLLRIFNDPSLLLRTSIVSCLVFIAISGVATAGPPFKTDDPEPVEYKHYEIYLASQYSNDRDQRSATLPHVEVNYGLAPNLQFHVIAPFLYVKQEGQSSQYGYGDTELGFKYRFIEETSTRPQVGTFPFIEIPSGDSDKGLGNGKAQYFLPLWLQKSWGPWTTYGGGGYWINPGEGNKNWAYLGWQVQREITKKLTLGAEIYYKSASREGIDESKGFTIGAIINITEHHHLLLSAGQDVWGPNYFNSYIAYQYTFGP
ncbi:MAG: transporter [Syntrophales bacterium]|nr:transporter [Syntrophales bacterium]